MRTAGSVVSFEGRRGVRRRWAVVVGLALVGSVACLAGPVGADVAAPVRSSASFVSGGLGYVPLSAPCRAVDTRVNGGAFGPDVLRAYQIAGSGNLSAQGGASAGCGIPDGVDAVQATFTATGPTANGYVRAFAKVDPPVVPNATLLNYTAGRSISNSAKVPLRTAAGTQDLYVKNFGGTTQIVIDILGYFRPTTGADYVALGTPCRALNTVGTVAGPLPGGAARAYRIAGPGLTAQGGPAGGCIPDGVAAAEISVTVVSPTANGYLQVGPNSGSPGALSTILNYTSGTAITNTAAVALSDASPADLVVQNNLATAQVVIDVHGYYTLTTPGTRFQTVTPCRTCS